jgi:hypothetical protein
MARAFLNPGVYEQRQHFPKPIVPLHVDAVALDHALTAAAASHIY